MERRSWNAFNAFDGTVFDVRSPLEYARGHLPGSVSLPLFTDNEREQVGIAYKREGRQEAVSLGLDIVSTKINSYIDTVLDRLKGKYAKVLCWRGGMRSESVAWLLHTTGIPTVVLDRGYKAYRKWVHAVIERPLSYRVVAGLTGTGKTKLLRQLQSDGEQVLDLEHLANHRGSVFGALEKTSQPTTEQFENSIAHVLSKYNTAHPVWVEDESRIIGSCHVPEALFARMQRAPLHIVECPLHARLENLYLEYGNKDSDAMIACIQKIRKKIGGERSQEAISLLQQGRWRDSAAIVLQYYDAAYRHMLEKRKNLTS